VSGDSLSNEDVQKSVEFKNYISENPDTPFVFACLKTVDIDFSGDIDCAIDAYIEDDIKRSYKALAEDYIKSLFRNKVNNVYRKYSETVCPD
jgi:hypothetical protein